MLEHDWQGKGQDAPMFVFHSFVIHLQEEENDCHDSETHQQNTLQQGLLCEKNSDIILILLNIDALRA